ncbi:TIGR03013 family XrtA/PEP-CTERM system glycosyltransferase [Thiohalorhabdus sp.]|uniref:TIGR03013 family XrtA/PEP-CTERM system glycosyltransferase n=1 Tax=Thiohalorhabdus sp. TaxID=3094134 RepID=UPI002FC2A7DD
MGTITLFKHHLKAANLVVGLLDFLVVFGSILVGAHFRFFGQERTFLERLPIFAPGALAVAAVVLATMLATGLYQRRSRYGLSWLLPRLVIAFGLSLIVLGAVFYLFPTLYLGRGIIALGLGFALIGILALRWLFVTLLGHAGFRDRVLVLGTGKGARALEQYRRDGEWYDKDLVGYVHIEPDTPMVCTSQVVEKDRPLPALAERFDADELVVAVDERRNILPVQDLLECRIQGLEVTDLLTFLERETGKVKLDLVPPSWFTYNPGFLYRGMARRAVKRVVDLAVGGLLLVVTSPLMLAASLAIGIESGFRGPILYRQTRVGEDDRPFQILKFRSMRVDAEQFGAIQWAEEEDPRITRSGRVLRKYRLDELPQILNILSGEMSFVGPRPERPEIEEDLLKDLPYYTERYRVKPGLTGWAQISYPYGASRQDSFEKLQYDLYYVKNYSLFLDLLILMVTTEVVIWGKGSR